MPDSPVKMLLKLTDVRPKQALLSYLPKSQWHHQLEGRRTSESLREERGEGRDSDCLGSGGSGSRQSEPQPSWGTNGGNFLFFCDMFKFICRVGQKLVYGCKYEKHSLFLILIFLFINY